MQRYRSLFGALILTLALVLAACSNSVTTAAPPVSITFWYTEGSAQAQAILSIVQTFNKGHATIHVNAQATDVFSLHDAFIEAAKSGHGAPDLFEENSLWTPDFAGPKYITDLNGKVGDTHDFLTVPLAYGLYQGQTYGVPQTTDFLAMYYNKASLQQANISTPPTSFDDMRTDLIQLSNSTSGQYGFATQGSSNFILPFIYAYGGDTFSSDGKTVSISNSGAVTGFQQLLDFIGDGSVLPPSTQDGITQASNAFKQGKVAIIFGNASQAADLKTGTAFSGGNAANFGVAAIPTGSAGDVPRSPASGQSLVVYAGSAHQAEAITFLNYLDSTQSQITLTQANTTLPTRASAYHSSALSNNALTQEFQSLTGTAKTRPLNAHSQQLYQAFDTDIQQALLGQQTAKEALDQVAKDWRTILAGNGS